ncbi:MAG TPA: hypothetical protein VK629_22140 [Steroidobacteraceae bacterium]|nr:hypothetical protein [Steroidobacteraceae bacterium]
MSRMKRIFVRHASAFALCALIGVNAQAASTKWKTPKTEHGQPNLQGVWDFGTATPLQRPKDLGEKRTYTEAEAQAVRSKTRANNLAMDAPVDLTRDAPKAGARIGQEADMISAERRDDLTRVNNEYRTSLIVDPPDGQIPSRQGFVDFHGERAARGLDAYDGPDTMDVASRCLAGPGTPTMYPYPWNANLHIVQNEEHVLLSVEQYPDARIVRLNGQHPSRSIRAWLGDAIGHWEGKTLVVHTANFRPEQSYAYMMRMSDEFELTERFTLVSQDEILYSYTAVDPKAYSAPFTAERILKRLQPGIRTYEVACHEGNYSMGWMLSGARKAEQDVRDKE